MTAAALKRSSAELDAAASAARNGPSQSAAGQYLLGCKFKSTFVLLLKLADRWRMSKASLHACLVLDQSVSLVYIGDTQEA